MSSDIFSFSIYYKKKGQVWWWWRLTLWSSFRTYVAAGHLGAAPLFREASNPQLLPSGPVGQDVRVFVWYLAIFKCWQILTFFLNTVCLWHSQLYSTAKQNRAEALISPRGCQVTSLVRAVEIITVPTSCCFPFRWKSNRVVRKNITFFKVKLLNTQKIRVYNR